MSRGVYKLNFNDADSDILNCEMVIMARLQIFTLEFNFPKGNIILTLCHT